MWHSLPSVHLLQEGAQLEAPEFARAEEAQALVASELAEKQRLQQARSVAWPAEL